MDPSLDKSNENYPTASVITSYACFGGAIGGGLIGLIMAMLMILECILERVFLQKIVSSIVLGALAIPTFALFGFVIGLIPATLTGCLVAHLKLYRHYNDLLQSAIIGAISTVICALLLMVFSNNTFSLTACIFATMIGSISGYLTGLSVLPND
ncbi:hypothetical protein [Psychrobacter alimentarius]|uniref:hypothetical protein n=1 Tax=Psychrobacter alimentarius TaxID=261164 RepID=UPI003FD0663D